MHVYVVCAWMFFHHFSRNQKRYAHSKSSHTLQSFSSSLYNFHSFSIDVGYKLSSFPVIFWEDNLSKLWEFFVLHLWLHLSAWIWANWQLFIISVQLQAKWLLTSALSIVFFSKKKQHIVCLTHAYMSSSVFFLPMLNVVVYVLRTQINIYRTVGVRFFSLQYCKSKIGGKLAWTEADF